MSKTITLTPDQQRLLIELLDAELKAINDFELEPADHKRISFIKRLYAKLAD